jgi:hypothetical protein
MNIQLTNTFPSVRKLGIVCIPSREADSHWTDWPSTEQRDSSLC